MIQPFKIIEGIHSMKYKAVFVTDSKKKAIENSDRYNVFIEIDPWNKIKDISCECMGFKFGKGKLCKHLYSDNIRNPGLLQLLKQWKEIDEFPTTE